MVVGDNGKEWVVRFPLKIHQMKSDKKVKYNHNMFHYKSNRRLCIERW